MFDKEIMVCDIISKFKFKASNYTILVAEDSKSINKILVNTFIEKGFHCYSANSLHEANELLSTYKIDYIVLDINFSDGSGLELINRFSNSDKKIFVITTQKDEKLRDTSYKKGVIDFVIKDKNFLFKVKQIITSIEQLEKNRSKTVLIVDDSVVIQAQLGDILSNRNYQIKNAMDTHKALEIMQNNQIDLIILDIQLKNENGLEFLQKHHSEIIELKKIPVLVISSNINAELVRSAIKLGTVDVLQKPYVIEEIVLKVDLWIDYKRQREELICSTNLLEEYKDAVDESNIVSKGDLNGNITYVNDEFCKISGYKREELIGKPHNTVRHPDNSSSVFKELWNTIKKEKKSWKGKLKNRKKNGEFYWVDVIIKPVLDPEGNILEFIGLRHDITEEQNIKEYFKSKFQSSQKNLSTSLKLSKEYERAIDESNIVSRTNLDGKITYVNKKFEEVSGYVSKEILGQTHKLISNADTNSAIFTKLWYTIKNGMTYRGIMKNMSKDQKPYWIDLTIVPIKNNDNKVIEYMSIAHDLTELFNLHKEIEETQKEVVYKMGEVGETRSKETGNHVKRVAEYSRILAKLYGLSDHEAEVLFTASPMHDIGKVGIPDSILKKQGKLTADEFEIMKSHAEIGYNVLKGSKREVLQAASIVSYEHHEKWDGNGYPRNLKGEDIHIYGRITALADVFDALGSNRCYKKAWEDEKIFELFKEERGKHFDPRLVDLFFENLELFFEIRDKFKD